MLLRNWVAVDKPKELPKIISLREASARLGVALCTVRLLVKRNHVRYQRIGKSFYIPEADMAALIEKRWKQEGVRQ